MVHKFTTTLEQGNASKAWERAGATSDKDIQAYQEQRKKTPLGPLIKKYESLIAEALVLSRGQRGMCGGKTK